MVMEYSRKKFSMNILEYKNLNKNSFDWNKTAFILKIKQFLMFIAFRNNNHN